MAKLFNRAKMTTATTGSGTVTLGSASNGFQTFAAAGVSNGDVVQYVIEENSNFEIGTGTYSSTGTSLTRSPTESSNSDNAITLAGQATVSITATHADFSRLQHDGSDKVTVSSTGASVTGNLAVSGTVDGRNVASDGSKLDGIEANAKNDQTITAGSGLSGGGTGDVTLSHSDTSSQASVNNSGGTVIQDVTVDTYGHVTGLTSYNLDGRYYTETEADSRFVNVTGDTMTGDLTISSTSPEIKLVDTNSFTDANDRMIFRAGGNNLLWQWFDNSASSTTTLMTLNNAGQLTLGSNSVFHDGYHPNADKWTTARTLSLSGDVTGSVSLDGSGNASLSTTVGNDSHTHVFGNITSTSLSSSSDLDGYTVRALAHWGSSNPSNSPAAYGAMFVIPDGSQPQQLVQTYGGAANRVSLYGRRKTGGTWDTSWTQYFSDHYHPNADKWTTARTLSLTGDVTGSVSWDGSGNASLATTVANDSHTHDGRYYTETEADGRFAKGQISIGGTDANNLTIQGFYGNSNASSNQPIDNNAGTIIHMRGSDANYKTQLFSYSDNRLWQRGKHGSSASWSGWSRVFMDNYHPNADKWTTARTLSLSGDASGSVSWDGSANATLSVTVANDSHSHSNYLPKAGGTMTGELQLNARLDVGDGSNADTEIRVYKSDNNVSDHIQFYNGTTRVGEIGCHDTDWLRINDATAKNIYTPRYIRADGGFFVDSTAKGINGSGNFIGGTIAGASDYGTLIRSNADDNVSAHTEWQDDKQIRLGNSADFRMYHASSNSHTYFQNVHHGKNTYFQNEDLEGTNHAMIYMRGDTSNPYLQLFQNGSERLRTLSGGVGVTGLTVGDVDASPHNTGGLQVSNTNNEKIVLSGSTTPYIRFQENTTDKAYIQWNPSGFLDFRNQENGHFKFQSMLSGQSSDLILLRHDTTTASGEDLGSINFGHIDGDPDYPTQSLGQLPVRIVAEASESTGSSDDGARLRFFTKATNGDKATSPSERMRIEHDGYVNCYVGLNMNNTDIYGCDQLFHHGDTNTYMQFHASDQWRVVVGGSERLEVKNSSPHVLVSGDLNSTSDERLKKNIKPIDNALTDICQLEGVTFDWKDTGTQGQGFIAQQVEPIIPDVVNTDEDTGMKSINYVGLIGHLVEAIKTQQTQINDLKAEIQSMKS